MQCCSAASTCARSWETNPKRGRVPASTTGADERSQTGTSLTYKLRLYERPSQDTGRSPSEQNFKSPIDARTRPKWCPGESHRPNSQPSVIHMHGDFKNFPKHVRNFEKANPGPMKIEATKQKLLREHVSPRGLVADNADLEPKIVKLLGCAPVSGLSVPACSRDRRKMPPRCASSPFY
jgi:hypothetical protein